MKKMPRASRAREQCALRRVLHSFGLLVATLLPASSARALIITEIMYHPEEVDDRPFEWIEIYNENADPLDLSGYSICNGVALNIPPGTWLEARSFLVLCADSANVTAKHGITNVLGDWFSDPGSSPSLSNGGERIEICNPGGMTVAEVSYNDRGNWPSGADGTGHSLALVSFWTDIDDADSWALSLELGGTPGEPNGFTDEGGAGTPPPSGMEASGFITKWLALGPYTGASCNMGARLTLDWLRESAGGVLETALLWSKNQVVNTNFALAESDGLHPNAGTALPTVKEYAGFSDTIDLNEAVYPPNPENVMSYSFVYADNVTAAPLLVDIACASDDGISILLNGVYVHSNDACRGAGGPGEVQDRAPATLAVGKNLIAVKVFENGGGWSFRLRFEERGTGVPIVSRAKIQITTDHTQGLRFGGGGTPIEPPTEPPPPPPPGEGPPKFPVILSEGFFLTGGDRWIELHNESTSTVDLGGFHVTDDPSNLTKSQLAPGTTIAPGAYRSFTETQLGLSFAVPAPGSRVFFALVDPVGPRVVGAYNFEPHFDGYSEARVPGDNRPISDACDPTRDAPNVISVNTDVVFNEIMYHPIDGDGRKEYVELYNKGPVALDLTGWRLSDGLDFDLPPGTVIASGGYLVIARDPSLFTGPASIYGLPASVVVGPATPEAASAFGALRDRGERLTLSDQLGRTADTVRFHDGGEWSRWADGGGSSLELIDAAQDNRRGQAWDASDDSPKAATRTYSYIARHGNRDSELALALLAAGITVVDDVSVIGGGVTVTDTPFIGAGETWRYFKGTQEPPAAWKDAGFADGSWLPGTTGIGYGDNDDATTLTDMQAGYMTIFCRKTFTVADRTAVDELVLSVVIDDGFYAYLNGAQVAEYNVTSPAFDAAAPVALEPATVDIDISAFKSLLVNGTNVLAIQVHNAGLNSSDLSFNPRLVDRTTTIGGGSEQLTNGTFNSSTAGWVIEGTHIRSGRTTVSPIAGAGSLRIIAAARGDNKVNRIETPDAGGAGMNILTANQDVQISFRARWVVGSQSLLTNGYDHEMARSHALDVPLDLGSPGARNQVTQRLMTQTGSSNLGPVITDVSNDPAVPAGGTDVKVRARVLDADGVGSVEVRYALNNPSVAPASVAMTRVAGTDFFEGTIPGQAAPTRVVYHITATDAGGRAGRYPADITQRSHAMVVNPPSAGLNDQHYCIYRHDVANPATPYQSYRMWMTQANQDALSSRRLHSNDPVEGSFVFGSRHMYHQASTRFGGSPFARAGWGGSFRVRLPRDNPLHGRIRRFGLESHHGSGVDARERISHYLIRQQNQGSVPVPYAEDFVLVRWQVNDATSGVREHYWVPDGDFVSLWFPGDDDGDFFEMDDRFLFNDAGGRAGNADARVLYPPPYGTNDSNGDNKENYRYFHGLRAKNGADEYANFIAWAKVMDPSRTNDATFDQQIWDYMNVEEMLRMWAVEMNIDDWDSWGLSRGKNCYLYRGELDGRFNLIAWDLELTFGNTGSFNIPLSPTDNFSPGGFGEVNRLMNRPKIRRMYYSILDEMVNGPDRWFHSDHLGDYAARLQALGMTNTGIAAPGGFIDQRAAIVQQRLQAAVYPQVRLVITTNGGNNFSTAQSAVSLQGTAPAEISEMLIVNGSDDGTIYSPAYSNMTSWTIAGIPLLPGANALTVIGMDLRGGVIDSDSITVTSTAVWNAPAISSLDPAAAPAGQDIEVLGTDFHNGVRVFFGAVESTLVAYNENGPTPDRIVARVPPGAGTVDVAARNADNKTSNTLPFTYSVAPPTFIRGDANGDTVIDLSDAVRVLLHLFSGVPVDCEDALDVDDNELLDITDSIRILHYVFQSGAAPAAPFPAAGTDPGGAALGCER
jgi:hypothetical protein